MSPPVQRHPHRDDRAAGFTLVELLATIVILGIIMGGISGAYTVLARASTQTQDRLNQSRGPKFASVYWTPDVSSSETVNPSGVRCGTSGTAMVTFRWTDDRLAQPQVTTWAITATTTGTNLVRMLCNANALATPLRTTLVAPDVGASGVEVQCDTGSGLSACASPATPSSVVLDVTTLDGRTFTIDANRQVS